MAYIQELDDTICFIHEKTSAYKTLMYGQWSVAMFCASLAFLCVVKNIWSRSISKSNLTGNRVVLRFDMTSIVQTLFMFFVIGVCWMFLLLFIIPAVQENRNPPDWMDYRVGFDI